MNIKDVLNRIGSYIYSKANNEIPFVFALLFVLYFNKFRKTYSILKKSQWWTKEKLNKYQETELKKLVKHVYENVPYYKKLFDENNLKPEDIKNLQDLQKIPFLTKEVVKKNIEEIKASNYQKYNFASVSSGGSTGKPVKFFEEKGISHVKEIAYFNFILKIVGCSIFDRCVYLRGTAFSKNNEDKFYECTVLNRCLNLSSFHMNEENLDEYVKLIRKFKPRYIYSYSSSLCVLVKYMKKNNIPHFPTVKAIICGGENLYPGQREIIEKYFNCRLFMVYGHAEQAAFAFTCDKSSYYHVFPQYGIVELIDKKGKPIKKEGESGEIVATGFKNHLFPLIRYRTGDIGIYTSDKCSCGRNFPLLKSIKGRIIDYILTGDNRPISMSAINMHSNVFENVEKFQFYQEKKGELYLRIIKGVKYTPKDTENIKKELLGKFGKNIDLKIIFVDNIPLTPRGKHKFLIQKIPIHIEILN